LVGERLAQIGTLTYIASVETSQAISQACLQAEGKRLLLGFRQSIVSGEDNDECVKLDDKRDDMDTTSNPQPFRHPRCLGSTVVSPRTFRVSVRSDCV
jgi:hypothetical protein